MRPAMSSWPGRAAPSGGKKGCAESIRNVSSSSEPDARSSLAKVSGPINYLEGFYITVGSVRKTAISRVQNLTRMVRITSWKSRTQRKRGGEKVYSQTFLGGEGGEGEGRLKFCCFSNVPLCVRSTPELSLKKEKKRIPSQPQINPSGKTEKAKIGSWWEKTCAGPARIPQ